MIKTDRKEQIIKEAARLFYEKGYLSVSMRDLAKGLNIKAASLYNHISSKQDILAIIVMDLAESFSEHIIETFQRDCSAIEKIEEVIEMQVSITFDKMHKLACMNKEWRYLDQENREHFIKLRENYESLLREIIVQGIENGELDQRDPDIINYSLLSTLRTVYHWHDKSNSFNKEVLIHDLKKSLIFGISKN